MSYPNFTLPKKTPYSAVANEQLLLGFLSVLKMLFVSLSLLVLFVVLFVRSFLTLGLVLLSAGNLFLGWAISLISSTEEVRAFAHFLATATR